MFPGRVLYLLAIVLCCVSVTHADDPQVDDVKRITDLAKEAQRLDAEANNSANETLKAIQNSTAAEESADKATREAEKYAHEILELIKRDKGNTAEIEKKKAEGLRIVKETKDVVAKSRDVIKKTKEIKDITVVKGYAAVKESEKLNRLCDEMTKKYSQQKEESTTKLEELQKIKAQCLMYTKKDTKSAGQHAIDVSHDAIGETLSLQLALTTAENAANQLENTIQQLEAAVTTAETEKLQTGQHGKNQVESPIQPQTQGPTVGNPHPNGRSEAGGKHEDNSESSGTAQTNGNQNVNGEENMSEKDQKNERKAQTLNTTALQNPQQPSGGSETVGEQHTQKKDNTEDKRKKRNVKETPSPPPSPDGVNVNTTHAKDVFNNTLFLETMKTKDGSSGSPALLRVPLLLLLLSVLGCIAVC
ncbi:uncharacterized protein TM35_000531270 [Trypanosoma theileri]|uniref:Mucin-associated surface protein (MASP) n=1 Tax=Trypanosoma theileri TaxID=67003 RepID=A0A1X0NHI7_9TRYP|nr:uncharacterized protein TM35_000531270 [Trypanosoma theileri]ORC83943.1 hypothetical protein TM35_000531270 [Trypanosoma theileri]